MKKGPLEPAPIRKDDSQQPGTDEQSYKNSLRRIPEKEVSKDPWGSLRENDKPKSGSKKTQP